MKRALIVDDSKTAQLRLKKMLERYDLSVDIAFSAEEALDYLTGESPSVIFMDHHMEGMDGLEALTIIKANPKTAVIPVIMYTSQQGDVYMGQARALGALGILSKDTMKSSNLERALETLNICPVSADTEADEAEQESAVSATKVSETTASVKEKPPVSALTRDQVSQLLEYHVTNMREQMYDNSISVVRKIADELDKKLVQKPVEKEPSKPQAEPEEPLPTPKAESSKGGFWATLVILLFVMFQLFQTRGDLGDLQKQQDELLQLNQQQQASIVQVAAEQIPEPDEEDDTINSVALLDVISWAMDLDMQFSYAEAPLGEYQVTQIASLVYRLAGAGFWGELELNVHFGNLCVQQGQNGNWMPADDAMSVEDCTFFEDVEQDIFSDDYLSVTYLNFEQTAAPITSGQISMQVNTVGLDAPRIDYPVIAPDVTAKEWNAIASQNSRISIGLRAF